MFVNLLTNALKFTPEGGSIQVSIDHDRDWAHISVTDTGEGFARSFVTSMFQPFSQEDSTSTRIHGGLGIGLMIVQNLVEAHGGHVRGKSGGKGAGSTFIVDLPRIKGAAPAVGNLRAPLPSDDMDSMLHGLHVLIVEDDLESRQMLRVVLGQYGAEVLDASSVREAFKLLDSASVDVVISDLGMPDIDGYTFMRALRRSPIPAHDVPAIALSAFAGVDEVARALAAGFGAHIAKPVDPRVLAASVSRAAGRNVK